MMMSLASPIALVLLASTFGLVLGKIKIGRFALGSSGALFAGLALGWWAVESGSSGIPVVGTDLFTVSLAVFIAAVALSASRYLAQVLKVYGAKLLVMGLLVPITGALSAWGLGSLFSAIPPRAIPGVFTGALTSSPGLAAAIEQATALGPGAEGDVGFGYAVGYVPGVLTVVLGVQLLPLLLKMDVARENRAFCEDLDIDEEVPKAKDEGFRPLEFFLVCAVGYAIGLIKVPLGPLGSVGLGTTGGILAVGLLAGHKGRLGPLDFRLSTTALSALREWAIVVFLAVVGLRYGHRAVESLAHGGLPLLAVAFGAATVALSTGFLIGRYVLKLNWILLAGALCGAMTSTPGLGAAVDATGCDDVATGYGAVYPVALLSMVIFTIVLSLLAGF